LYLPAKIKYVCVRISTTKRILPLDINSKALFKSTAAIKEMVNKRGTIPGFAKIDTL